MSAKKNDIEEARTVPGEDKKKGKGAKFLPYGKYFLILMVILVQVLLAFTIVEKNYDKIYSFLNSFESENDVTYKLDELIVNPAGTNGQRFLVVEISLELMSDDHIALIKRNKQKIKHNMIEALSSRTVDQLIQFEEREQLRDELSEIINEAIGLRSVRNLYYTRYVMQ